MMRWLSKMSLRFRSLFLSTRVEQELTDELRCHLERQIEAYLAQGMPATQARCAALRELGGIEQHKEECRDMRGMSFIEDLMRDVRIAGRMLRRNPGFTSVAVLALARRAAKTDPLAALRCE